MELDAVEARGARPLGGVGEEAGQHLRQLADVLEVSVGDALAVAHPQALPLPIGEDRVEALVFQLDQSLAERRLVALGELREPGVLQPPTELVVDLQEAPEELLLRRSPLDGEEVDQLNEEARPSVRCFAHRFGERLQSGHETVVADAQQRTARHVADAGRLDHDRPRLPFGETPVPGDHRIGHLAVAGGTPGHHRGNPSALLEREVADLERLEEAHLGCLLLGRPPVDGQEPLETLVAHGAQLPDGAHPSQGWHALTRGPPHGMSWSTRVQDLGRPSAG